MACVQFQIHTDKENATSAGLKMPAGGTGGGKSFHAASVQALKTPRRALGSVNEVHRVVGRGTAPLPANALKPNKVITEKNFKPKQQQTDKENSVMKKSKQEAEESTSHLPLRCKEQKLPTVYHLPDIEYMPPPSPPRDEDEDILPAKERASSYVHKLLSWRPQCLFGTTPESDDEEERERQRIMEELDNLPLPCDDLIPPANLQLSCEELDLDSLELPAMDDVLLPHMDADGQNMSAEVTLPTLDDSIGLVPHMGSLEIMDQSLPSTSSL